MMFGLRKRVAKLERELERQERKFKQHTCEHMNTRLDEAPGWWLRGLGSSFDYDPGYIGPCLVCADCGYVVRQYCCPDEYLKEKLERARRACSVQVGGMMTEDTMQILVTASRKVCQSIGREAFLEHVAEDARSTAERLLDEPRRPLRKGRKPGIQREIMQGFDLDLYCYEAELIRVIDGDTVDLRISLGLDVYTVQRIRLYGIDAPEMRGEERGDGIRSRDWLVATLTRTNLIVRTIKDDRGKYGRYLGIIYADGENVNAMMIEEGMAGVYG